VSLQSQMGISSLWSVSCWMWSTVGWAFWREDEQRFWTSHLFESPFLLAS